MDAQSGLEVLEQMMTPWSWCRWTAGTKEFEEQEINDNNGMCWKPELEMGLFIGKSPAYTLQLSQKSDF